MAVAVRACLSLLFAWTLLASAGLDILHGQSARVLAGVVRSGETERPLPGARVALRRQGVSLGQAVSGADGRFEITLAERGAAELLVSKAGYAPSHTSVAAEISAPLDVRLLPGAVLTGRIVDAQGRPAPGVVVRLRSLGAAGDKPGVWVTATTDDQGDYRVGSLAAGRYEVATLDAGAGAVSVAGMNLARVLSALPEMGRGGAPPQVTVELRSGQTTSYDHVRQQNAALVAAQNKSLASSGRAASELRNLLGGQPVDPATAGRVAGVVSGPDARPMQAVVRLTAPDGSPPLVSLSDSEGRYEFEAVPPGRYRVIARSGGTLEGTYGATADLTAGQWVQVREKQRVDRIDIVLPRAAVATGRVVDVFGEPLEGLDVAVLQMRTYAGRPVLQPSTDVAAVTTDDRGQYRLHGLLPGRYVLVVSDPEPASPITLDAANPANVQALTRQLMSLALSSFSTASRPHAYYPGRPTVQDASPIVVDAGVDALGLDMVFAPAAGVRVSGIVLGPDGTAQAGDVTLNVSERSGAPQVPPQRVSTDADGTFTFPYVVPGEYVLQAEDSSGSLLATALSATRAYGGGVTSVAVTGGGATTDVMASIGLPPWTATTVPGFASTFVQVAGEDVSSITLRMTRGATLSGRLVFEGPSQPSSAAAFALGFVPADSDLTRSMVPSARSSKDGTFEAFGLVGPMRLIAANTPEGWWLKSATIDGVNAVEEPVAFDASPVSVEVVFSSARSGIGGRVVDRSGKPVNGAVLVFAPDSARWHAGTRYVRQAAAADGLFELSALPPGRYVVTAVDGATASTISDWQEPDLLNRLIPLSQQITVREGNVENVRLTVIDMPH